MKEYQQRVIDEKNDLGEKIKKLTEFTKTELFNNLSETEQDLLTQQLIDMNKYHGVLTLRVTIFK